MKIRAAMLCLLMMVIPDASSYAIYAFATATPTVIRNAPMGTAPVVFECVRGQKIELDTRVKDTEIVSGDWVRVKEVHDVRGDKPYFSNAWVHRSQISYTALDARTVNFRSLLNQYQKNIYQMTTFQLQSWVDQKRRSVDHQSVAFHSIVRDVKVVRNGPLGQDYIKVMAGEGDESAYQEYILKMHHDRDRAQAGRLTLGSPIGFSGYCKKFVLDEVHVSVELEGVKVWAYTPPKQEESKAEKESLGDKLRNLFKKKG